MSLSALLKIVLSVMFLEILEFLGVLRGLIPFYEMPFDYYIIDYIEVSRFYS